MTGRARAAVHPAAVVSVICTAFLLLPTAMLLLHVSWPGIWREWTSAGAAPLLTSVWTTFAAMLFIAALGTPVGWLLARRRSRFWRTLEWLLHIPLLMPPLVIGLLLIYAYGPYGPVGALLGRLHLSASNTALAVILAQLYEALPYYIFAVQAGFRQIDEGLEHTSWSLGQSPLRTFRRVTLPLSLPALTAGLAMAFARAIGAFGAVIVVAYYPQTLPVGIWVALEEQGLPAALPLALLLLAAALPAPLALLVWRERHRAATGT